MTVVFMSISLNPCLSFIKIGSFSVPAEIPWEALKILQNEQDTERKQILPTLVNMKWCLTEMTIKDKSQQKTEIRKESIVETGIKEKIIAEREEEMIVEIGIEEEMIAEIGIEEEMIAETSIEEETIAEIDIEEETIAEINIEEDKLFAHNIITITLLLVINLFFIV